MNSAGAEGPARHGHRPGLYRTEAPGPRRWVTDDGDVVTDVPVLDRLRRLAVPPAWTQVWASVDPDALLARSGPGGDPLFVVAGHTGPVHLTSAVVNAYLHRLGGAPATAKAFRTWSGTVVAAAVLGGAVLDPPPPQRARAAVPGAVAAAATLLGNTPAVARASYIHPAVLAVDGARRGRVGDAVDRAAERLGTRSVSRVWLEPDIQDAVHRLLRSDDPPAVPERDR